MQAGFKEYIQEAFNARPLGMWVPPNWVALGVFGLLGAITPGFWVLGAGLELGYLYFLASHPRFQNLVKARIQSQLQKKQYRKLNDWIGKLEPEGQKRYQALEQRCRNILELLSNTETTIPLSTQGEGLRRLLWIFLRLLLTRQSIVRALQESQMQKTETLDERIKRLEDKLKNQTLNEDLRKSLSAQLDILHQRQDKQRVAKENLAFLDAELIRIQEQVELLREQAVLSTGPEVVSQRIDQIANTLGDTTQWIQEQQRIYGNVEDLLSEPPPLTLTPAERESE